MKITSAISAAIGRMGVGRQVVIAFALVLGLTAALGTGALRAMGRMDTRSDALADKWLYGVGRLAETRSAMAEQRELEVKHSRTADGSYHKEYEEKIAGTGLPATASVPSILGMPILARRASRSAMVALGS